MRFIHKNQEHIFIHVPRTAGTYIENQLARRYRLPMIWPRANTQLLFGLHKVKNLHYLALQHLTYQEMVKFGFVDHLKKQHYFTVVRNPFDRVLSLYHWWRGDINFGNLDNFLDKLLDFDMDNYHHEGIITSNPNFNYRNMTCNVKECMYHFIPQYQYLTNSDGKIIADYKKMNEIHEFNNDLHLNLKFNKPTPRQTLIPLTKEQIDKIIKIYHQDFEYFNYSTEYSINMDY